jgi:hypothetical protein
VGKDLDLLGLRRVGTDSYRDGGQNQMCSRKLSGCGWLFCLLVDGSIVGLLGLFVTVSGFVFGRVSEHKTVNQH